MKSDMKNENCAQGGRHDYSKRIRTKYESNKE